jgi:RND family efflux transporter MFP subunit
MNTVVKYSLVALLVAAGGTLFYNKVYIPKSTYTKVSPTKGNMNVKVFGIGNVDAKNVYPINAQTSAKILNITKDEGDWVKKGELLVEMDPVDLPFLLQEAQITVKKASLELIASKKELLSLIAQKDLAKITYKRYAKLKEQSFVSQSEYDKAKADLDALDAQIAASQARINSSQAEIIRARKGEEALQVKLSRYKITAPVDGYIIARDADVQENVQTTQAILKMVDPKTVWIRAYIDEKISGAIAVNQKATITLRSKSNIKYQGYVSRIVPQSDAVTGEREVDVMFDELPIPFYINEQAEVQISTEKLENILKIPANTLVHKDEKSGVWVVSEGMAHFKTVKVLAINNDIVAVSGLNSSDKIILPSNKKKPLYEGSRVH